MRKRKRMGCGRRKKPVRSTKFHQKLKARLMNRKWGTVGCLMGFNCKQHNSTYILSTCHCVRHNTLSINRIICKPWQSHPKKHGARNIVLKVLRMLGLPPESYLSGHGTSHFDTANHLKSVRSFAITRP